MPQPQKLDLKRNRKDFFSAKPAFELVQLSKVNYLMVDGIGSPDSQDYAAALGLLYPIAYKIKFASKNTAGDFVVPPLEALWWADDMDDYLNDNKDQWRWTVMIMMPDFVGHQDLEKAKIAVHTKVPLDTSHIRLEALDEGTVVQIMHHGPYSDEAPVLHRLHHEFMPANNLAFNGLHHEIYLSDPRKTEPSKLRTILRQPVKNL